MPPSQANGGRVAVAICLAAMVSLAIAMGVGRFAFTPLFPLMVREGLLDSDTGTLLAASNYLGYLVGAWVAARIRLAAAALLALGLICTVLVTAAVGWASSVGVWASLRFVAGVMSAWTLVATSAWGLGWLSFLGRAHWAGALFAGVGLGVAFAGLFCWVSAGSEVPTLGLWIELGALAGVAAILPLWVAWRFPTPETHGAASALPDRADGSPVQTGGLVVCYSCFGFGYILPATYLPALARQLVDDPQVFGLAWPVFGAAAALSTVGVAWGLKQVNRMQVWAGAQGVMAIGVLLPVVWASVLSLSIAALLVGGTFMVITMVAMQEARSRAQDRATGVLGQMTAGFALGQLMGPLVSASLGRFMADFSSALNLALGLSAAGLVLSACHLWREDHCRHS